MATTDASGAARDGKLEVESLLAEALAWRAAAVACISGDTTAALGLKTVAGEVKRFYNNPLPYA